MAHLVALAFAVAASANLPVVLLTLYWKRCNTGGVVAGLVVGTFAAIGLVLVSPNMTYPTQVRATQERAIKASDERIAKLERRAAGAHGSGCDRQRQAGAGGSREGQGGRAAQITALGDATTLAGGLERAVVSRFGTPVSSRFRSVSSPSSSGSLLYRDKRAEEMWEELYVRSNTGIGRAAASH